MLTPIFIDFTKPSNEVYTSSNYLNLEAKDPIDLYTENTDPSTNTKIKLLAPRYYVLIHSPANKFQATKKINIEKAPHSINKNQLRVELEPSIGYGINACYRVEYWEWVPVLNSPSSIPTTKKVHEEYWYVPSIDSYGFYIPNYYYNHPTTFWPHNPAQWNISTRKYPELYWPYYYNRIVIKEFKADRIVQGDYVIDTMKSKEALSILSLLETSDSITTLSQPDVFYYSQETKDWTFSIDTYGVRLKRLISGVNGLEQSEPTSGDNVLIKVRYYLPFHPCDLVLKDEYLTQYTN